MNWRETESYEDAARRLIGVMDERAKKKAAERLEGSAKIQDRPLSPGENADGASDGVSGSLKRRPQQFTNREAAGDPVAGEGEPGNGWVSGGVSAFCDFPVRPPAQPCADPNGEGFTIEAKGPKARNVRDGIPD